MPVSATLFGDLESPFRMTRKLPSARRGFLLIGTVAGPWTDMRVVAASVRALGIDRAQASLAIEVETVPVGQSREGENAVLLIEVFDEAFLAQAFGNTLQRLVTLEGIDHLEADQVINAYFYRQGATRGVAISAQAVAVARPGFQAFGVGRGDQTCLHGGGIGNGGARS